MERGDLSTPYVSHRKSRFPYSARMSKEQKSERTPLGWGSRFRYHVKQRESSLAKVAEKMGLAESTVRSWTNGTRDINLSDFLRLCDAAEIDPAVILFAGKVDDKFLLIGDAWVKTDEVGRAILEGSAEAALNRVRKARKTGTAE